MTLTKAIATPPGEPTKRVPLTQEEIDAHNQRQLEWEQTPAPFDSRLEQKFLEAVAAHEADLTDEQIAEAMEASATVQRILTLPLPVSAKKKAIVGTIKRTKSLPASVDAAKQQLIDFVEAEMV